MGQRQPFLPGGLISPSPDAAGWKPPTGWSVAQFLHLCGIDIDAVDPQVAYIDSYCTSWLAGAAPNQGIRPSAQRFDPWNPQIGYARFSEARSAWQVLLPAVP